MKLTALLVVRGDGAGGSTGKGSAKVLANASDVSQFGYFQRASAKEVIVFAARTIAERMTPNQRHSVVEGEYTVHFYNKMGLCGFAFTDSTYPMRSAFLLINKVLDEYQNAFGSSWKTATSDSQETWPFLQEALVKYQDPAEADKFTKIQRELDETKVILHKTMESILERGEKLESLVTKSTDLSMASQVFYKHAKKTNQCCSVL